MTLRDRDRLVVLKKAQKSLISASATARFALIARINDVGDQAVIHGVRGRPSHRKLSENTRSY